MHCANCGGGLTSPSVRYCNCSGRVRSTPARRPMNHYDYLEKHLPTFFQNLGIDWERHRGVILAHGDKCYGYRQTWEKEGLHFFHGVAIYLLTYTHPFSQEVRGSPLIWVSPRDWVLENKDRFLPHLPPIEA